MFFFQNSSLSFDQRSSEDFESIELNSFEQISSQECDSFMQILKPNIVKNIMRSFFNFMVDKKNQELICELITMKPYTVTINSMKKFIKNYKFNNMSLFKLMKHQHYKILLEYYLTFDICEWLSSSKINDLKQHRGCIEVLKECCANIEILDQIAAFKKINL